MQDTTATAERRAGLPGLALRPYQDETDIPVIATEEESYAVTSKIHGMTVKTQPQDTDKIPVIKRLIMEHVDMKALLGSF